ncbi:MAG: CHAT domain-containing protein, partial [Cyanobacteria bacterium P01_E01_bin.42]
ALINLGSLEEAISSYNRALQFQPDYHLAWLGRGIALINLGSLEEAIASYDHALQIQPDYHLAWANRSIAAASSPSPDLEYQHNFLYHFQRRLAQFSHYTLSIWENAPVGTLHATSLQNETAQQIKEAAREHFSLKYPQLNNRGYNGRITSLKFPLKQGIIHPNTLPWGFLYHQLGKAQYNQANNPKPSYPPLGENPSRGQLFHQAKTSHETALETLTFDQYPELHLEVLQDLIPVCVDIKLDQEASQHLKKGIILLERHLENKPPREQERLSRKFSPFYQLKVEEFIRNGDLIQAIETAEERKNYCLQWFPQTPEKLEFSQIQQHLCTPTTAILYWHLSPVSLSTFLILAQGDPILIEQPPNPQPWGLPDSASDNTPLSQTWERGWGRGQHQNLINRLSHWKTKDSDKDKTPTNWKDNLSDNLQTLAQILNIPSIRQELQNHGIQTLILIPHRDLHLLPLHAFFDCPAFYLPSAYLGCQNNTFNPPLTPLNLIENPKSTPTLNNQKKHLAALPFAEIEATLLRHQFPQHRHLTQTDITQTNTETLLKTPARVFHFCGHAAYNSQDPKKSCLFLHETEVLTVETIRQLDLKHYDLVSLAACETAVTGSDLILDEYVGLVSAFLSSGVTYVLSTLWQVESFATSLFILEFYRHLAQNPPHLALQLTRDWLKNATPDRLCESCDRHLQNLTKFEHRKPLTTRREQIAQLESTATPYQNPYYWAAFILAGYHKSDKI